MIEQILPAILKKYGEQIIKKSGEQIKKLRVKFANSSHQYRKNYRERYGQLKVFCVGCESRYRSMMFM